MPRRPATHLHHSLVRRFQGWSNALCGVRTIGEPKTTTTIAEVTCLRCLQVYEQTPPTLKEKSA